MKNFVNTQIVLLVGALFTAPVGAQVAQHVTLKEAAQAAVLNSPEVQARWHIFREAAEEVGVAQGEFLPKVDLTMGTGRQKTVQKSVGLDATYNGHEGALSLRQMLFDGFAASNEVKRLGKAKLVRYFELLDASENTALEAGRAYFDVLRYRYQVVLAEENYLQHQAAYEQLRKRAESGVGKRVDVDQAASRLALADVNLTTTYANLHDVSARYLRIVGEQPAKEMPSPEAMGKALPGSADAVLGDALKHNPALRASIENIEAAQYDLDVRRSAFMPRLDLVARRDAFSNYQDEGRRDDNRVELRLNYNLFNGGSDAARSRQFRERKNTALDQREKACRDVRQTLSIAYNDTLRLTDQISYIATQVSLVEKTRTAYRDQFNIGQRTLLDLLNTQNEFFDARRSQGNADADLGIAYLRSYAGMGRLLETLGLKRVDADNSPDENDLTPVDLAQLCPVAAPLETTLDREALGRKVKEMLDAPTGNFIGSRPQPVGTTLTTGVPDTDGAAITLSPGNVESVISARTTAWSDAWVARDVRNYLAFYAPDFKPEGGLSRDEWVQQRQQRFAKVNGNRIEIQNLSVRMVNPETALATFRQVYVAGTYADTTEKTLEWRKQGGQWLIVRESARPAAKVQ